MLVVVAGAPVLGSLGLSSASAQTTASAQLRAQIDHVAQQWFDAQADVERLDNEIVADAQRIHDLQTRVAAVRVQATARAVDMYVGHSDQLGNLFDATSALDTARREQLIDRANDKSDASIITYSDLATDLRREQHDLVKERDDRAGALQAVTRNAAALDTQLHAVRLAAVQQAALREVAAAKARDTARRSSSAHVVDAPALVATPAPSAPLVVPPPPPNPAVSPVHDQPFLVCTRARESHGDYSVVSPSGIYFGAYQFSRDTWDVTALHTGRHDLVGVLPNTASAYDQDAMAWSLYQWQGNAPWGGRC